MICCSCGNDVVEDVTGRLMADGGFVVVRTVRGSRLAGRLRHAG